MSQVIIGFEKKAMRTTGNGQQTENLEAGVIIDHRRTIVDDEYPQKMKPRPPDPRLYAGIHLEVSLGSTAVINPN
jgi:hypothetical protein